MDFHDTLRVLVVSAVLWVVAAAVVFMGFLTRLDAFVSTVGVQFLYAQNLRKRRGDNKPYGFGNE